MSHLELTKQWARLLKRWPADRLRPAERHFQNLLRQHMKTSGEQRHELKEVNAAYLLLEDAFAKKYPLGPKTLRPLSNPHYYENLKKELDELPDRSWLGNVMKRMGNLVRWK